MSDTPPSSFTGRKRNRSTHWSVKFKDRLSHAIITVGGLGTIVAVTTVFLFLISVVIPLFKAPERELAFQTELPSSETTPDIPVHVAADEYNLMSWAVFPDGLIRKFRLDTGEVLDEISLVGDGPRLTAWSFPQRDSLAVFGFEDGTVRFANISFTLDFMEREDAPEALRNLAVREVATWEDKLVQMTPQRQLRIMGLSVELQEPVDTGATEPITLLDHTRSRNDINYAAMTESGRIFLQRARGRMNMMTRQVVYRTTTADVEIIPRTSLPRYVKLTGLGDNLYVIWEDGILNRFDTRNFDNISFVETVDLTPEPNTQVTAIGYMIGKTTLLVGDSKGGVTGWFRVRPGNVEINPRHSVVMREIDFDVQGVNRGEPVERRVADIQTPDNQALVPALHLAGPVGGSPVVSLSPSERKRMFVAGHANGAIRLHNATVQHTQFEVNLQDGSPASFVLLNPRDSGLIGISSGLVSLWNISVPHSEATLRGYFAPIWYEGYDEPRHAWQSTGGTDDFESKFGIMPLVFGTVKATLYSMIFAVPIALLGAIYTSEFLHPKARSRIKPAVEMMASLPSVVLGFLAGLVLAQFIETRVPATLLSFITVPFTLIFAASCWQLLSRTMQMRLKTCRFLLMILAIPAGMLIASQLGPRVEAMMFRVEILNETVAAELVAELSEAEFTQTADGTIIVKDIRTWLSAHRQDPANPKFRSSPVGGWMILFLPLSCFITVFATVKYFNPVLLRKAQKSSQMQFALLDLAKFVVAGAAALLIAWMLSTFFGAFWDPRGSYIDQYGQRNALVVGFIMGFAVIPIIYTIADDAMSAVPDHLRSASLGAGATRWQTAVRIVVPTSMSGLFSAVMIGFGRAVGETMIVLMAAGNTPIMEWNIFSGFRTLSANIAVEMMEAVEGSTNYRTLFLTAVILFSMTFVINTIAEKIRQSYRKKAYQL